MNNVANGGIVDNNLGLLGEDTNTTEIPINSRLLTDSEVKNGI